MNRTNMLLLIIATMSSILVDSSSAFLLKPGIVHKSKMKQLTTFDLNSVVSEQEMEEFFEANRQWSPLFKSLLVNADAPASTLLGGYVSGVLPDPSDASPWKERPVVPSDEEDKKIVGSFLDNMHKFLIDIPVTEGENTASDHLFIEEGRRVLMIGRYRVLREGAGEDKLFDYCWSEIAELFRAGDQNSGSIILTPSFDRCLKSFCDINVLAPLSWLGITADDLEVTSITSDNSGVRFIHKLQGIPQEPPTQEPLFGGPPPLEVKGFGKRKSEKGFGKRNNRAL